MRVELEHVGKMLSLPIDAMPHDVFDIFSDAMEFTNDIEYKYIRIEDAMLTGRAFRKAYEHITFKVWKLGAWSTVRIDALERMNPEQLTHWLGDQP